MNGRHDDLKKRFRFRVISQEEKLKSFKRQIIDV